MTDQPALVRRAALAGASLLALLASAGARAQQAAPGDPNCPRTGSGVICTGNLGQGIVMVTSDNVDTLTIRDLTAPIAPAPGLSGVDFIRTNGSIEVSVESTARGIIVNGEGNGIELYAYDADIRLTNAVPITGRSSQPTDLYGIRTWVYDTDGVADTARTSITITNSGAIDVELGHTGTNTRNVYGISARIEGDGELRIHNSGAIRAAQGSSRIIAFGIDASMTGRNTFIEVINDAPITIDNPVNGRGIDVGLHGLLSPGTSAGTARIVNNAPITGRMGDGISFSGVVVGGIRGVTNLELVNNAIIDITTGTSLGSAISVLDSVSGNFSVTNIADLTVLGGGGGIDISVGAGFRDFANYVPGAITLRNSGDIITDGGEGIIANGDRFDIVNTGDITSRSGFGADAISSGEWNQIFGQAGFRGNMANTSRLENDGDLSTAGTAAYGVRAYFVGGGTIINRGDIATSGGEAHGIWAQLLTGLSIQNSGTITVSGANSIGVAFEEYSVGPTSTIADPDFDAARDLGSTIIFATSADIRATGEGGIGISVDAGRRAYNSADAGFVAANYFGTSSILVDTGVTVAGGSGEGAGIRYAGRGTNTLDIRGTVTAASGRAVIGGDGSEVLLNAGRIEGSVSLGGGSDTIRTLAGGVYAGTIDMGAGDDLLEITNATSITQAVGLGAGDDRVVITPGVVFAAALDGGEGDDRLVLDIASGTRRRTDFASGTLTSMETIEKLGAGTFLLDEGLFSRVLLQGGTLQSAGDFGTAVQAAAGTFVLASGRLGAVSLAGGATLRPGASIGTLATGDLNLGAGSILEVEVDDQGLSDRIDVTGTVNVSGAILRVLDAAGGIFAGTDPFNYIIIGNDGTDAVIGTFASIVNQLAFLTPTVSYAAGDGNDVRLTLTPNNMTGTSCPVTSTADSGPGTLRACVAARPDLVVSQLPAGATITHLSPIVIGQGTPQTVTLGGSGPIRIVNETLPSSIFDIRRNSSATFESNVDLTFVPTGSVSFLERVIALEEENSTLVFAGRMEISSGIFGAGMGHSNPFGGGGHDITLAEGGVIRALDGANGISNTGSGGNRTTIAGLIEVIDMTGGFAVGVEDGTRNGGFVHLTSTGRILGTNARGIDMDGEEIELLIDGRIETRATDPASADGDLVYGVYAGANRGRVTLNGSILTDGGDGSWGLLAAGRNIEVTIASGATIETLGPGSAGILLSSSTGHQLVVAAGAEVLTRGAGSYGVELESGRGSRVTIAGLVSTEGAGAAGVGATGSSFSPSGGNFTVELLAGGRVQTEGAGATGIVLLGGGNRLTVAGTVTVGAADGIRFAGEDNRLENSGTIASASGNAVLGGDGADTVVNSGTLTGAVRLGGGVDAFTLDAAGTVTGAIDGGDGEDRFILTGGSGTSAHLNLATTPLSGFEQLAKQGAGDWSIAGNADTLGGLFRIEAGRLAVDADMRATDFTILAGARLGGTGRLGDVTSQGGVLAPGNSIGTINVTGLALDQNSTLEIEVNDQGQSDRIAVIGTVSLGGARLSVLDQAGGAFAGANPFVYTIIDNDGTDAVVGVFGSIVNQLAFLTPTVSYSGGDGNDVLLTLTPNNASEPEPPVIPPGLFPTAALTFNQRESATALDRFGQTDGTETGAVYRTILFMTAEQARATFDITSGEIYPVLVASELRRGAGLAERLIARGNARSGEGWGLWGAAAGHDARTDGDGNGARFTHDGISAEFGIDYAGPGGAWAFGFGGGYDDGDADLAARASRAERDGWHLGGYARYGNGGAGLTFSFSGAWTTGEADVTRRIAFGTIARTATARVDLDAWALGGEARYGFAAGGGWSLGPVLRIVHAEARLGRFAETGADSLDLSGGGTSNDDARTLYGGGLFARWEGASGALDMSLSYQGGGSEPTELGLVMAGAPGTPYRVRAARGDGGAAALRVTGTIGLGGGWSLGADLAGAVGADERSLQGSAVFGWRF